MLINKITIITILLLIYPAMIFAGRLNNTQTSPKQILFDRLSSDDPYSTPDGYLKNIENIIFNDFGRKLTGPGFSNYTKIGNKPIDQPISFLNYNRKRINVANSDTSLYYFTDVDTSEIDLSDFNLETYTPYKRRFFVYKNQLYIGDGINPNLKYNGEVIAIAGIEAPTSNITATLTDDTATQLDTGAVHNYKYRYKSDTNNFIITYSNPYSTYRQVTIGDDTKAVYLTSFDTDIITTNKYVNYIEIWRTKNLNKYAAVYYKVDEISINDTYYIDTISDFNLGTKPLTSTDKLPLARGNIFAVYKGIVFVAGNRENNYLLYHSNSLEPDYMTDGLNFLDFTEGREITGLAKSNGVLVVFTYSRTYTVYIATQYINDLDYWRYYEISSSNGCINQDGISSVSFLNNGLIYPSNEGLKSFSWQFVSDFTGKGDIVDLNAELKDDFDNYILNYKSMLSSAFYDNVYYLSYSTNGIYNNKIYVLNTKVGRGSYRTNIYAKSLYNFNDEYLLIGSSLYDGTINYFEENDLSEGMIGFDDLIIDTYTYEYNSTYEDTILKITTNKRLDDDDFYTDAQLTNLAQSQTLYFKDLDDSTFPLAYPIIENGTNTITVLYEDELTDTNYELVTATKNVVLQTNFNPLSDREKSKLANYLRLFYSGIAFNLEVKLYRDNEDTYESHVFSNDSYTILYDDYLHYYSPTIYYGDPIYYSETRYSYDDFVSRYDEILQGQKYQVFKINSDAKHLFRTISIEIKSNTINEIQFDELRIWYKDRSDLPFTGGN